MLKIGELAKVCNVSVETLRYYDRMGVLCADFVDEASGYRYYVPEKVTVFHTVEQLKKLDFSLAEIKRFLNVNRAEQCRMYQDKKREMQDSIQKKREQMEQIDLLCKNPQAGIIPLNDQILNVKFEDDPNVIGRWEYVGNADPSEDFSGTEKLKKLDVLQSELFFLPGGGHVWMYFWTKGILYCMLHEFNVIVPNHYRIFRYNGETYMKINWMVGSFFQTMSNDNVRIYRLTDKRAYSERETYRYRDNVDLPYKADDRVIGEWETVDVINALSDFSSDPSKWVKRSFWISELKFFGRGICYKTFNSGGTKTDRGFKYTAGMLLDDRHDQAEHYRICTENDTDFLIMEHKSADYSYTGKVLCYYVFRRT